MMTPPATAEEGAKVVYAPVDVECDETVQSTLDDTTGDVSSLGRAAYQCWNNRCLLATSMFLLGVLSGITFAFFVLFPTTAAATTSTGPNGNSNIDIDCTCPSMPQPPPPPPVSNPTASLPNHPPPQEPQPMPPPVPAATAPTTTAEPTPSNTWSAPPVAMVAALHSNLTQLETSAFMNCRALTHSYRDISRKASNNDNESLLVLWAHLYTPNNRPPTPQVGPFDDPPKPEANTAYVSFRQVKSRDVAPNTPIALVLHAYDAVNWTVNVNMDDDDTTDGTSTTINLVRVVSTGYKEQHVDLVTGGDGADSWVPWQSAAPPRMEYYSYEAGTGTLPGSNEYFVMTTRVKGYKLALEEYIGAPLFQYDYCYSGSTIMYHLSN